MGWKDITPSNRGPPRFKNPAQERTVRRKQRERKAAARVGEGIVKLLHERKNTMAKKSKGKSKSKSKGKATKQTDLFEDLKMGSEDEEGFATVYDPESGETWQYEEGDEVQGIYFDRFRTKGGEYGDSICYKVYDVDNDMVHLVWGTFVLNKYMERIKPGTYVRVEYKGMAGRAHNFGVQVHEGYTKEYAKVAKDLIAKAGATSQGDGPKDDTIPF